MTTPYDQWINYAVQVMPANNVDVRDSYSVRELVEDVRLIKSLKDVWYGFFMYMKFNAIDRMDEALPTFNDVNAYTSEFLGLFNFRVKQMYDAGERDRMIHVSPRPAHVETRTILNWDDLIAGNAFEAIYGTTGGSGGTGGGGRDPNPTGG